MEEFIPLSSGSAVPKSVKNVNKINHEKKEKRKRIKKEKKEKMARKIKNLEVTDLKPSYRIKLIFQQRCPLVKEICELHPLIRSVSIPKRPPSVRHCFLKFKSAEEREEVRSFLDKKHFEPFKGILRCQKPLTETLNEIKLSNPELLDQEHMTSVDIKHAKFVYNKKLVPTSDVKWNSTARELFLRYGIPFVFKREKQDGGDSPSFSMGEDQNGTDTPSSPMGEEQNGRNSPYLSMSEEDDDMNAPESY